MTEPVFVALGSNLGDRRAHLAAAVEGLARLPDTGVSARSTIEETEPIGPPGQGPYLNQMLLVHTGLGPPDLLREAWRIEGAQGRDRARSERWGPRTLDIDLVVWGDRHVDDPGLTLPHPELPRRGFWLRGLAEVLPASWEASACGFPVWARVTEARRAHIDRVAGLIAAWAYAMGRAPSERARWIRAALLHDAARDYPETEQRALADVDWPSPALWHGPAAATLAARHGERDEGVLAAVKYHTVGHAGWDDVGRMLYLADYLEPGRSHARRERAALAAGVPEHPTDSLREVARRRRTWLLESGLDVPPETEAFWSRVGAAD